jgi:hypothetical protein
LIRVWLTSFDISNRPDSATSFEAIAPESAFSNTSAATGSFPSAGRTLVALRHATPKPQTADAGSAVSAPALICAFIFAGAIAAMTFARDSEFATRPPATERIASVF